jgi:hypothetical protein
MTAIGYLRWFFNYQREEIQLLLGARGVQISTGKISELSEEFLLRFYTVHKKHSSQMKELFETNKGFILHLDGSAEAGDEITFTAKEGMTEITIDSWIMPSESRHYIKPFLQHIKDTYGTPFVVIGICQRRSLERPLKFIQGWRIRYAIVIMFEILATFCLNIVTNSCEIKL